MDDLNVLIASDSFKGSATSREVGDLIEEGIRRVVPDAKVKRFSIADGGEGTVEALVSALDGTVREVSVIGPIGDPVLARYGMVGSGTAVIEMAESSGITLIDQNSANARRASTFGVGEVILDAIRHGARRILIGLGGSATSDGGAGMAKALGVRFLDADGDDVPCGLTGLENLASIDLSGLAPQIEDVEFIALTDVSNPLIGSDGAVCVYGPQKGIGHDEIEQLDGWMRGYARILEDAFDRDIATVMGAGAAGGLGAALVAFCKARIAPGIEYVLDAIGLEEAMAEVDLVVTGEGRMDSQSAFGKAPVGVARRAKRLGIPVIAVVGSRADDLGTIYDAGIDLVVPTVVSPSTLEECIARTNVTLPIAGESCARAFLLGKAQKSARSLASGPQGPGA